VKSVETVWRNSSGSNMKGNDSMKKRVWAADVWLITGLLLLGAAGLCFVRVSNREEGVEAVVTVDGAFYGKYSLMEEQTVSIQTDGETGNVLVIKNKKADMTKATCPDKLCVHQRAVSRRGETIVCLPHKVVVEISGGGEADFDSISR